MIARRQCHRSSRRWRGTQEWRRLSHHVVVKGGRAPPAWSQGYLGAGESLCDVVEALGSGRFC